MEIYLFVMCSTNRLWLCFIWPRLTLIWPNQTNQQMSRLNVRVREREKRMAFSSGIPVTVALIVSSIPIISSIPFIQRFRSSRDSDHPEMGRYWRECGVIRFMCSPLLVDLRLSSSSKLRSNNNNKKTSQGQKVSQLLARNAQATS